MASLSWVDICLLNDKRTERRVSTRGRMLTSSTTPRPIPGEVPVGIVAGSKDLDHRGTSAIEPPCLRTASKGSRRRSLCS